MWYFLSKMNITLTFLISGNQTELSISCAVSPELCNNNNIIIIVSSLISPFSVLFHDSCLMLPRMKKERLLDMFWPKCKLLVIFNALKWQTIYLLIIVLMTKNYERLYLIGKKNLMKQCTDTSLPWYAFKTYYDNII